MTNPGICPAYYRGFQSIGKFHANQAAARAQAASNLNAKQLM